MLTFAPMIVSREESPNIL